MASRKIMMLSRAGQVIIFRLFTCHNRLRYHVSINWRSVWLKYVQVGPARWLENIVYKSVQHVRKQRKHTWPTPVPVREEMYTTCSLPLFTSEVYKSENDRRGRLQIILSFSQFLLASFFFSNTFPLHFNI